MKPDRITALIVDGDAGARETLEFQLKSIPGVEIAGSVSDAASACQILNETTPDLIFLEVEISGENGFDLVNEIRRMKITSCVIFQNSSEKHAIRAIRIAAFDYLLKPVDHDDVKNVVARFTDHKQKGFLNEKLDKLISRLSQHEKIKLNTRHGFIMVDPSEIFYCKADWSYTEVNLSGGKKIVVSMNIGKVEELLDPTRFARISRSVMINLSALVSFDRKNHLCVISCNNTDMEFHITGGHLRKLDDTTTS